MITTTRKKSHTLIELGLLIAASSMLSVACQSVDGGQGGGGGLGKSEQDSHGRSAVEARCFDLELDLSSRSGNGKGHRNVIQGVELVRDDNGYVAGFEFKRNDIDFSAVEVRVNGDPALFFGWNDGSSVQLVEPLGSGDNVEVAYCIAQKVEVCHRPPGNPENERTIRVGNPALSAHLAHGDVAGSCEGDVVAEEPPSDSSGASGSSGSSGSSGDGTTGPSGGSGATGGDTGSGTDTGTDMGSGTDTGSGSGTDTGSGTTDPTEQEPSFNTYGFDAATTSNTAYLLWYTPGVPSTSQVIWGLTPDLENASPVDSALVETHSASIGGLMPNTTYYFKAISRDASGGVSYSQVIVKTTKQ